MSTILKNNSKIFGTTILDGKWEGNLFNFYYRVYGRLVQDLDVPFILDQDAMRKDETHVHEALREVLVNTLIHADHLSSRPITILKFKDRFEFSNPGRLRIPIDLLYDGGVSDPRNPNLLKMFKMIGLGEQAGSGFPKILRAWREQQWFRPLIAENIDLNITKVALPMVSFIPEDIEQELRKLVGDNYCYLKELDRIILLLAHRFGEISNNDIQGFSQQHPRDIGDRFKYLVDNSWLQKYGHGRGTYYCLPTSDISKTLPLNQNTQVSVSSSDRLGESSDRLGESSDRLGESSDHLENLKRIAQPVRDKGKVAPDIMRAMITRICQDRFLTQQQLGEILNRSVHTLRTGYLKKMIEEELIELRYPDRLHHPEQAYRTKE